MIDEMVGTARREIGLAGRRMFGLGFEGRHLILWSAVAMDERRMQDA